MVTCSALEMQCSGLNVQKHVVRDGHQLTLQGYASRNEMQACGGVEVACHLLTR